MASSKRGLYHDHEPSDPESGAQRLSLTRLQEWQRLEYGMFIHFGLATYNSDLASITPADYQPPQPVDTDQWARVARDAGMKYIIFTAQHCNSFTMWHTKMAGVAHVGQSAQPGDVVASFVESCRKYDVQPAFYYSQSRFTPWINEFVAGKEWQQNFATRRALDCVKAQLEELLTTYGPAGEIWIDGPSKYGTAGRYELYHHLAALQPEIVIAYNGWGENLIRKPRFHPSGWPSDVLVLEVMLPPFGETGPWRQMELDSQGNKTEGMDMYIPVESCCVIHRNFIDWFYDPEAILAGDAELLGMRLIAKTRNANLVLNVTPDQSTRIPEDQVAALMRLRENMAQSGALQASLGNK